MENRKAILKQEILAQSVVIGELENKLDRKTIETEIAKMAYEELLSATVERLFFILIFYFIYLFILNSIFILFL